MRKRTSVFALFGLAAVLSLAAGQVIEEIVAIVNDDVITLSQYKEQYDSTVQQLRAALQGEEYEKQYAMLKKEILNMMITDLLLMQQAKEKDLNVGEQLKAAVENIKKENNIASDDDLKRGLQKQGMDYDQWIKQLEDNMLKQGVIYSEVDRSIVLDDSEIIGYYRLHPQEFTEPEEYKIRAVYLSTEGKAPAALEEKKKEIGDKVKAGEPFNVLAKDYSDGPAKESEGDLGKFKKGELDKDLELAVSKLKAGETSGWVETKNGWYLLKLEEKKDSRLMTFEEVKKNVEENLFSQKKDKKLEEYLKGLKEKSYIKILKPNPLDL
ncbi:MAG: peptidyl-prolyl cis-trans isomerase [Candidatus Aminicenantes bacterium]|nr:peptidyl-prolyl cis-trans isomerase [Candidatus Aminicenantes bacterium]